MNHEITGAVGQSVLLRLRSLVIRQLPLAQSPLSTIPDEIAL